LTAGRSGPREAIERGHAPFVRCEALLPKPVRMFGFSPAPYLLLHGARGPLRSHASTPRCRKAPYRRADPHSREP